MAKFLRVIPIVNGPFQLEYMRHTGRWCPMFEASGDIHAIARFIEEDPFGLCTSFD